MFCAGGNKFNEKTLPRPWPRRNHIRTYLPGPIILETSHPALCQNEHPILTIFPVGLKHLFQAGRSWTDTVMENVETVEMVETEMLETLGCPNQAGREIGLVIMPVIDEVEIPVPAILGDLLIVVPDLIVSVLALIHHDGLPNPPERTWRGLLLRIG
jgi:hypothetical protein